MKNKTLAFILILAALLSACTTSTADSTQISSGIFTAVAQTLTAQYTPVAATGTPAFATMTPMTATATLSSQNITSTPFRATSASASCDNAIFANDVTIPDGTSIVAGTTFTKTWSIKNTGTCAWTTAYTLKFASGNQMSGATTAIGSAVAAGNNINVSISMTAPTTAGTYTGYWRMANASGSLFGGMVSVSIVVPASTPTPTITTTPIPTNTPFVIVVTATPETPIVPSDTPVTPEPPTNGG
jgi:hypothetical protein